MKARISKRGKELLANQQNAYSLVEAIIKQGADSIDKNGIIEFDVVSAENPEKITREKVQIVSTFDLSA